MQLAALAGASYPDGMTERPESKPGVREDELEPIRRDRGFIVRLVLLSLLGMTAAAFVGWKLKGAASGCGAGLIRPGGTVIPQGQEPAPAQR
jgi:hypothetical protein